MATNKKKKPAKKSGGKKSATKSKSANSKTVKSKSAKSKKAGKVARSGGKSKVKSGVPKRVAQVKSPGKPKKSARPPTTGKSKTAGINQDWTTVLSPLDDRILVKVEVFTNRTPGGLYIPDTVEDKPQGGVVVAVGRGHRDNKGRVRPLDVKIGDKVLFPKYSGTTLEFGGMSVLVLREGDLLGVTNS